MVLDIEIGFICMFYELNYWITFFFFKLQISFKCQEEQMMYRGKHVRKKNCRYQR